MKLPERELKNGIGSLLQRRGFQVEFLPERGSGRTPDLRAFLPSETHLIEVKQKGDNPELERQEAGCLVEGEIVERVEPWGRRNRIAEIVKDGVDQLWSFDRSPSTYRLLWLHCEGRDPDLYWEQFHATLYGTTNIIQVLSGRGNWPCFYFKDSAFFRHRTSLDGAFLSRCDEPGGSDAIQLCLNSLSPRISEFRRSAMVDRFSLGLCDPDALEASGEALIADCPLDRREEALLILYLQEKYKREYLQKIDMVKRTVSVALDYEEAASGDFTEPVNGPSRDHPSED